MAETPPSPSTQPKPLHRPSWRKPAGMAIILAMITGWAWLVASAMEWAGPMPRWLSLSIYAVAGVVWIAPLGPLLLWMETGRWRR